MFLCTKILACISVPHCRYPVNKSTTEPWSVARHVSSAKWYSDTGITDCKYVFRNATLIWPGSQNSWCFATATTLKLNPNPTPAFRSVVKAILVTLVVVCRENPADLEPHQLPAASTRPARLEMVTLSCPVHWTLAGTAARRSRRKYSTLIRRCVQAGESNCQTQLRFLLYPGEVAGARKPGVLMRASCPSVRVKSPAPQLRMPGRTSMSAPPPTPSSVMNGELVNVWSMGGTVRLFVVWMRTTDGALSSVRQMRTSVSSTCPVMLVMMALVRYSVFCRYKDRLVNEIYRVRGYFLGKKNFEPALCALGWRAIMSWPVCLFQCVCAVKNQNNSDSDRMRVGNKK